MTLRRRSRAASLKLIDSRSVVGRDRRLGTADAHYCLAATVGGKTWSVKGPGATWYNDRRPAPAPAVTP